MVISLCPLFGWKFRGTDEVLITLVLYGYHDSSLLDLVISASKSYLTKAPLDCSSCMAYLSEIFMVHIIIRQAVNMCCSGKLIQPSPVAGLAYSLCIRWWNLHLASLHTLHVLI